MNKIMLIYLPVTGKHLLIDLSGRVIISETTMRSISTYREIDDMTQVFESGEVGTKINLPSTNTEIILLWKSSQHPEYQKLLDKPHTLLKDAK